MIPMATTVSNKVERKPTRFIFFIHVNESYVSGVGQLWYFVGNPNRF